MGFDSVCVAANERSRDGKGEAALVKGVDRRTEQRDQSLQWADTVDAKGFPHFCCEPDQTGDQPTGHHCRRMVGGTLPGFDFYRRAAEIGSQRFQPVE